MKTLSQLTATLGEAASLVQPDIRINLADEPAPGFFRALSLGHSGLQARVGTERVLIPLAELWDLVERHCPEFRPPQATKPAPAEPVAAPAAPVETPATATPE